MVEPATAIHTTAGIRAIEARGPAGLMERAGKAAAELALTLIHHPAHAVLILCGPGNNGGDGFTMARHLMAAGRPVYVVFDTDPAKLPQDARAAHAAFLQAGGQTHPHIRQGPWALAVDALFGIGLARPIGEPHASWIATFNVLPCERLALDIPSGLNADTGAHQAVVVRATHTLTFLAMKPGLITLDGPDCCGQIHVDTLGLDAACHAAGFVNDPSQFAAHLTPRPRNTHKGHHGNAAIVGGAPGMVGAALLAARAAMKLGAGRVFVGCLDQAAPRVDLTQPELMMRSPEETLALGNALAVGPGLGQSAQALDILRAAIEQDTPLTLDADALNLLAAHPVLQRRLAQRKRPTLLTPHPLEAARLLGCEAAKVQADRIAAARTLAQRFNAIVLLKGCGSVIVEGDAWWINRTGNPGMASAGMGDVLTGLITALLAQGWPAGAALRAATYLHGQAADDCLAQGMGPVGLCATDTLNTARSAFNRLINTAASSTHCQPDPHPIKNP